eukprot:TRINITY_DN102077_c0_g1_i1.p1 TRINITY_DN102077_c0_g1~~TRINITY_DN102077_c0_g1_i1.p1  ORF type:complete len:245 (+),score=36.01 TRINITY_DN102077_c0_g1_i1:73-807(+)
MQPSRGLASQMPLLPRHNNWRPRIAGGRLHLAVAAVACIGLSLTGYWPSAFVSGSSRQSDRLSRDESLVTRQARMAWHARDPYGVKHVETRRQAMRASVLKSTLEDILHRAEIGYKRLGDDEMQRRIFVDDVIMTRGCRSAYIHVSAEGDTLEQRQAFVWLVRSKGSVKSALARRFKKIGALPNIYFVESKHPEMFAQFEKAAKYPDLNLPDPFAPIRQKWEENVWTKWGAGDSSKPFPKSGYT